ncbi:MAG: hypothetical protein K5866_07290 [Treponema sp.]|nr:hypothetical protein [Treponema sp.]
MKRIYFLFLLSSLIFVFFACKSTKVEEVTESPSVEVTEEVAETPVEETEEVEIIDEVIEEDDEVNKEYLRSTNALSEEKVTRQEFEEDKATILQIIAELSEIMEKGDVDAWMTYIDPASIKYYSTPQNIRKAQKKLPDKTRQLYGIGDYFRYVFVPARKRARVDEIRYESKTRVKAVMVKEDESIVVYYNFVKIDGNWLVSIPEL